MNLRQTANRVKDAILIGFVLLLGGVGVHSVLWPSTQAEEARAGSAASPLALGSAQQSATSSAHLQTTGGQSELSPHQKENIPSLENRDLAALFDAIRSVESGGDDRAVGDGGASRGPYQIQRAYWTDACESGGLEWDYLSLVWSRPRCEYIMRWYWQRYCPDALRDFDFKTLARIHNGGPAGARKAATVSYWNKVKKELVR